MAQTGIRLLAWGSIVVLFIVTDTTMGLRPHTIITPNYDRLLALFLVGAVFSIAYPRHIVIILIALLAIVVGFELLQRLLAGRHGFIKDIAVKSFGVCSGIVFGAIVRRLLDICFAR
jgi:hypothetical protein